MKDINSLIAQLVQYGKEKGLVAKEDEIYTINRLLEILHLDEYKETVCEEEMKLEDILAQIMDWAYENGVMQENSVVYRDLFDTKLMGALVPAPSVVIKKFRELYKESPKKATDFYYDFSCNTDYIRRYRIAKDRKWKAETEYGTLDITINLSKPEKDPKATLQRKMQSRVLIQNVCCVKKMKDMQDVSIILPDSHIVLCRLRLTESHGDFNIRHTYITMSIASYLTKSIHQ